MYYKLKTKAYSACADFIIDPVPKTRQSTNLPVSAVTSLLSKRGADPLICELIAAELTACYIWRKNKVLFAFAKNLLAGLLVHATGLGPTAGSLGHDIKEIQVVTAAAGASIKIDEGHVVARAGIVDCVLYMEEKQSPFRLRQRFVPCTCCTGR